MYVGPIFCLNLCSWILDLSSSPKLVFFRLYYFLAQAIHAQAQAQDSSSRQLASLLSVPASKAPGCNGTALYTVEVCATKPLFFHRNLQRT